MDAQIIDFPISFTRFNKEATSATLGFNKWMRRHWPAVNLALYRDQVRNRYDLVSWPERGCRHRDYAYRTGITFSVMPHAYQWVEEEMRRLGIPTASDDREYRYFLTATSLPQSSAANPSRTWPNPPAPTDPKPAS